MERVGQVDGSVETQREALVGMFVVLLQLAKNELLGGSGEQNEYEKGRYVRRRPSEQSPLYC